jgi:hypothetical protein
MTRCFIRLATVAMLLASALPSTFALAQGAQPSTPQAPANAPGYIITLTNQGKRVGTLTIPREKSVKMITEADKIKFNAGTKTVLLQSKAVIRMVRGDQETLKLTAEEITIKTIE